MRTSVVREIGILALAACAGMGSSSARAAVDPGTVSAPYSIDPGRIKIALESDFAKKLSVKTIQKLGEEKNLETVGQVIALANPPANLADKARVSWVELDPGLSRSLGLDFQGWSKAAPGLAIGVAWVPSAYLGQIHAGERVEVERYGLKKISVQGTILAVGTGKQARVPVTFRLASAKTWYPGTNCEVEFPLVRGHAARLSSTAILHEGAREFVFKEIAPGQFTPQDIAIIDEDESQGYVEVLGDLKPGDRVIEAGAILLKPLLPAALSPATEATKSEKL